MKRAFQKLMLLLTTLVACIPACAPRGDKLPTGSRFGKLPDGQRLERIKQSPNYDREIGQFKNLEPTQMLVQQQGSRFVTIAKLLLGAWERPKPPSPLPMDEIDFHALDRDTDLFVWLGHSGGYLHLGGKRILIDPVFSNSAAPFARYNKDFNGSYPYGVDDLPDLDLLLISHDHWDHLDYPTLRALRSRVKAVVCPLGVGAHLESWGFDPDVIHEGDWNDTVRPGPDFAVYVLPARHFSGRWLSRNKTLWASFLLATPDRRVFYSGDGGYGRHFADIGKRFGSVDLAILENGQYNPRWRNSHLLPDETAQAAVDLNAKAVLPVHTGRFSLSDHPWDDPYIKLTAASTDKPFCLLTPRIGQVTYLDGREQQFERWWESVRDGEVRH